MKWFHSLITKITLIFALALIGIIAISFIFLTHERQKELDNMEQIARYALHSSYNPQSREFDFKNLENFGFFLLKDQKLQTELLKRDKEIKKIPPSPKNMRNMMRLRLKAITHERKIYILMKTKEDTDLIFLSPFEKELFPTLLFPLISISLVILLYIAIIKSIIPIYDLRKKVKIFANGNYDFECKSTNKDEIGVLTNEFHSAVQKIKKLRDSRQLFLRNIMHELKTPLTKGKFVTELIEEEKQQKLLQNIFSRQEYLLEEFSRIEKLSADELKLNVATYNLEDIVDFSLDILNFDPLHVEKNITPLKIEADFELFGTALKNLLDNGIKYSPSNQVFLSNTQDTISISNVAPALEFELEKYAQPYFLEGKKQKSSRGLGFGLFITWHIIKLHNMDLLYERENDKNIFTIKFASKN